LDTTRPTCRRVRLLSRPRPCWRIRTCGATRYPRWRISGWRIPRCHAGVPAPVMAPELRARLPG